jgi:hypothetical protein
MHGIPDSNCRNVGLASALGVSKVPKAMKTGTTICGVVFNVRLLNTVLATAYAAD